MYQLNEIKHVHLEISSKCNAACPLCPRNLHGYPFNNGYIEHAMTLDQVKTIFSLEFLEQLDEIYISGNFGDIVTNPDAIKIIEYFRRANGALKITASTNASARDSNFWKTLARLNVVVEFCIDGLYQDQQIYRQNTSYDVIINNASIFISHGGYAVWKMIEFSFNLTQRNEACELSKHLGFKEFVLVNDNRANTPVFDKNKNLKNLIGSPTETSFNAIWLGRITDDVLLEDLIPGRIEKPIQCYVKKHKSVYISSLGDVFPCCWLGFSPKTYGNGTYHQAANKQFVKFIYKNNALVYPLTECIEWFNNIEQSWDIEKFQSGRLVICNDVCGKSN